MAVKFKWPATCRTVTQQYGNKSDRYVRGYHTGIDLGCIAGSPIFAAHDGTVIFAGWNGAYGNEVQLSTETGLVTSYHHMSKVVAKKGDTVSAGRVIGYIGSTGQSTGPHLHFEVRVNGKDVDPNPYLNGSKTIDQANFVNPTSVWSVPGAIIDFFKWMSRPTSWLAVGMVFLGAVLLLMAVIGVAKAKVMGQQAVNAVKGSVRKSG